HEIRTPIFEDTQLFTRSVGEETDIVAKEMYTWHDRGGAESEQFAHLRDLLQTRLSMQVPPQHDEELLNAVRPLAEWKGQSLTLRPENTAGVVRAYIRSEEHTSELQSPDHLVCRLLLEKKKQKRTTVQNIT